METEKKTWVDWDDPNRYRGLMELRLMQGFTSESFERKIREGWNKSKETQTETSEIRNRETEFSYIKLISIYLPHASHIASTLNREN